MRVNDSSSVEQSDPVVVVRSESNRLRKIVARLIEEAEDSLRLLLLGPSSPVLVT